MTQKHWILLAIFSVSFITLLSSQEKLEVEGIVHSKLGGFKFPDDTVQKTAAAELSSEEVSQERGIVTVAYTGISGVSSLTAFKALSVSFLGTVSNEASVFGDVEILHNLEGSSFHKFMFKFASQDPLSLVTISYFDENDIKYASIRLKGVLSISEFGHSIIPFSSISFGHVFSMKIKYSQIEICDELLIDCTCWDQQFNSPCIID